MKRYFFLQNPHYEKHLSPLGQEILYTLINSKWNKERTKYNHPCNNTVLSDNETPLPPFTFNPADTASAPQVHMSLLHTLPPILTSVLLPTPVLQTSSLENENVPLGNSSIENSPFDFPEEIDSHRGAPPSAPTSAELVKTVHSKQPKLLNIASDNLVRTVPTKNNDIECTVVDNNAYKKDLFVFRPHLATKHHDDDVIGFSVNNGAIVKESASLWNTRKIGWDDMLDTDLFSDIDCAETSKDIQKTTVAKENTFKIVFSKSKPKKIIKPKASPEPNKRNIINKSDIKKAKTIKRKNQLKITDSIPKKIKKPAIEFSKQLKEHKFRKQKYTQVVNDWLNDVDPQQTVEEDNIDSVVLVEMSPKPINKGFVLNSKNEASVITKDENISNIKSSKKVVQAQLTNKDGVMKFEKPNEVKNKAKELVVNITKDKNESINKPKSKFIVPIKSQIPVKDISYKIISEADENLENHLKNIIPNKKGEILMIVVYSNGFCQLNQQHTENSCAAEGMLACIDDHFYYFKLNTSMDLIPHVLNNNTIICFDGKTLLLTLLSQNIDVSSVEVVDAKIAGALLAPDSAPDNFADLQKLLKFTPQFTIATECALQRAAWYTTLLRDCVVSLKTLLLEDSLWDVFVEIEMKLLPIIADMEHCGVLVDTERLSCMQGVITRSMRAAEAACHRAAGRPFQITSAAQVGALLYDELRLDSRTNVRVRETVAKGAKSTSEAMLKALMTVHSLPKLILEYRHLHKAHTTFLTGIAQHVRDGVVKPSWDQTAAVTGRIASNNPNLQAIPKAPFTLILFPGPSEEQQQQQLRFRSVYVARGGHALLAADFQHVECRVFAHAAADATLLDALSSERDLFRVLAAKWLRKPEPQVSAADRERTKRIVYASLYGAGARKLMDILDVSYEQALCVSASFNKTFPSLKGFGREVVARCTRAGGRLATLGGRARRFPAIFSADSTLRSQAERQAVNFVVQGSAADLCKLAMVATAAALRAANARARLLLQIHDELVWEVRHEDLHTAAGAVRAAMESCGARCGLALPLPVALSVGRSWGDMHEYIAH